jgi:hypothetical protein
VPLCGSVACGGLQAAVVCPSVLEPDAPLTGRGGGNAALDPDRREAFVLIQVFDLTYAETAQVCGCPVGTIRSRVARAREDLVASLEATPRPRRREA